MLHIFIVGLALGFYAAAIPGPINLEVIRRSISRGPRIGIMFGLGASLADVLFVLLSSLGAMAIMNKLELWGKGVMWMVGAVILFIMGVRGLMAKIPQNGGSTGMTGQLPSLDVMESPKVTVGDMVSSLLLGLSITLVSPPTIMFWVFNSLFVTSSHSTGNPSENVMVPYMLAAGVGVACCTWVLGASYVAGHFHRNLKPRTYLWVERIAGCALCGFATFALYQAMKILL